MLTVELLPRLQRLIAEAGVDGWLLYDFRGTNAIAHGLLGFEGLASRRVFAYIPREGTPVGIQHAIEPGPWARWPASWSLRTYVGWRELEAELPRSSRASAWPWSTRPAMPSRISTACRPVCWRWCAPPARPWSVRPTWCRRSTPRGRRPSARRTSVRPSGSVTSRSRPSRTRARWSPPARRSPSTSCSSGSSTRLRARGWRRITVRTWPRRRTRPIRTTRRRRPPRASSRGGDTLLIDLWARESDGGVYADQTWMASLGAPSARAVTIWEAVRDARDAALSLLGTRIAAGVPVRGAEADDAARAVITARGFGGAVLAPHGTQHRRARAARLGPADRQSRVARRSPAHSRRRLLDRAGHLRARGRSACAAR